MAGKDRRDTGRDERSRREPSSEEIAERAYARYEARRQSGHEDRSPEEDWYEAERELREAADTPPIDPEQTSIYAAPPYPPRSEIPTARSGAEERRRSADEEEDESANGSSEKRPRKVESFSPRPESAEKTHAEPPEPESMPSSFSPRPESGKTTRAAKKKPPARKGKAAKGSRSTNT